MSEKPILTVNGLNVKFTLRGKTLHAIRDVSLDVMRGESLAIPGAIGSEVFITYIGLGLPLYTPSLGNLINEGRKLITVASLRYQLIFPAIILSIITISFYIIGNAFADAADPKNHL